MNVMGSHDRRGLVQAPGLFATYVADFGSGLLRHATVLTADPSAAQDIVQTVLERAFGRWALITAMDHPDAYVRRMITNEAISARRRTSRLEFTDQVPEPPPAPDESGQLSERHSLAAELRKLPPRQRVAIVLRYFEDLSDAAIADQLGCAETTVRGYIWRGLRTLRVDIDESFASLRSVTAGEQR